MNLEVIHYEVGTVGRICHYTAHMCRGKDYGVGTLVAEERCGGNRVEQIQLGMCACDKVLEPASLQIGHNG